MDSTNNCILLLSNSLLYYLNVMSLQIVNMIDLPVGLENTHHMHTKYCLVIWHCLDIRSYYLRVSTVACVRLLID